MVRSGRHTDLGYAGGGVTDCVRDPMVFERCVISKSVTPGIEYLSVILKLIKQQTRVADDSVTVIHHITMDKTS
ncbi:hypothetical protein J6590_076279 [Homalodisca vitripennis]|nr:hypothetical protein J6590_076279 [Homalodisca vitripennis]